MAIQFKDKILLNTRKSIRDAIEECNRQTEKRKFIKTFIHLLPDFEIGESWKWTANVQYYTWSKGITIVVPWNTDEYDKIILKFQKMGWVLANDIVAESTWMKIELEHPELGRDVIVTVKQSAEKNPSKYSRDPWGQTCEVVVVGKEMKEVEKLEVRCNGGVPSVTQTD